MEEHFYTIEKVWNGYIIENYDNGIKVIAKDPYEIMDYFRKRIEEEKEAILCPPPPPKTTTEIYNPF